MTNIKTAMAAAFALGAAALLTPPSAQAMPVGDPAVATANISGVQMSGGFVAPTAVGGVQITSLMGRASTTDRPVSTAMVRDLSIALGIAAGVGEVK